MKTLSKLFADHSTTKLDRIVEKLPTEEFVKPMPEEDKYGKYKFTGS